MSVDKLLQQADKLLDKGKVDEALEKLKEAFTKDPNNELAANKLARTYVESGMASEAVSIYKQLGVRASASGKTQKAVAFFRQALEIDPNSVEVLERLAPECEAIGKHGEAIGYAQRVLTYYLPRKRYLDALTACALLAKLNPNDEAIRLAWLELLQYVRLEPQLLKALISLCGPPGLNLEEVPVGGDPTKLSPNLYKALVALIPFYPTDPMLPYALAWVCYRRGQETEAYKFLRESFRRNSTFCLTLILFARMLAEKERLDEAVFVYKLIKDKLPADRNVDVRSLSQQVAAFEEKNGWLNFASGFGDNTEVSGSDFVNKFRPDAPKPASGEGSEAKGEGTSGSVGGETPTETNAPAPDEPVVEAPSEVEIAMPTSEEGSLVIQFTGEATQMVQRPQPPAAAPTPEAAAVTTSASVPSAPAEAATAKEAEAAPVEEVIERPTPKDETKLLSPLELLDAQRFKSLYKKNKLIAGLDQKARLEPPPAAEEEASKIFTAPIETAAPTPEPVRESGPPLDPSATIPIATNQIPVAPEQTHASTETVVISKPPSQQPVAASEAADLGDDLLQQPTQMISAPPQAAEPTTQMPTTTTVVRDPSADELLAKADRYSERKNFYMARRLYRMAQSLGASEDLIRERLAKVRSLELPQSLYASQSSDAPVSQREREKLLRDLEEAIDFDDSQEMQAGREVGDAVKKIRPKIDEALHDADPRVRLDLGIAFFEMGLFDEASEQFERAGHSDDSIKREVEYLKAQTLFQKKDYPGAVSLLKGLCADPATTEKDKLAAFYLLAQVYEELQQPQKSRRYFEKVAEIDSNYRSVREKLETK